MDLDNVVRAARLADERGQVARAMALFAADGTIWNFTVGVETPPDATPPVAPVMTVFTRGWDYPPQMVSSIRQQLQTRLAEIDAELSDLGVTGAPQ